MKEVKSKEFLIEVDGAEVRLYFMRPNLSQVFEMDMEYRRIYAEAIRQGVATEAEIKNRTKKTGAWTEADQDRISDISLEISRLQSIFTNAASDKEEENTKIIEQIAELRKELISLISQKTSLLANTTEDIANDQRMHKFIELCCYDSSNTKFFDNRAEYENFFQKYAAQASEIMKQAFLYEWDTKEDFTEDWVEVKYFKQLLEKEKEKLAKQKEEENSEEAVTVPESDDDKQDKKKGRKKKDS